MNSISVLNWVQEEKINPWLRTWFHNLIVFLFAMKQFNDLLDGINCQLNRYAEPTLNETASWKVVCDQIQFFTHVPFCDSCCDSCMCLWIYHCLLLFLVLCLKQLSLIPGYYSSILDKEQLICVNLQCHLGYFSPCLLSVNSCLDSIYCSNEIFPRQPDLLVNPKGRGRETAIFWISSIRHPCGFQKVIS